LLITTTSKALYYCPSDTVKQSATNNSFLNEKVRYVATDSMVVDLANQKAYLYNNAEVFYEDMHLKAGFIEIDFKNNVVYAKGLKDSTGNINQRPLFENADGKYDAGEIAYNFDTKKGKIKDVITQQGEGYIHGRDIKKDSANTYYVGHGKYTTCDLEHPHFYIGAKKIKVIPDDKIITGPAVMYIADIPTPLAIPFGYFPNKKGRASGIIIPTYGESYNLGFFLKDGGFYFGGSEKIDLALTGDFYSNGSYGAKANSNYAVRYKYSGSANISYSRIIEGDRELPNSTVLNNVFVRWYHQQDSKANPSSRFSANVNAGSSSYNRYNGSVAGDYLSNTFQSNIAYSKAFLGTPFNFSANARHSQNTITKKMDITLPELALTMNRIYPFKNKNSVKQKWYDKIGVSATANARNDINTYDSTLFTNQTISKMRNGLRFAVPISTSLNVLKYFTLTPTINTASNIYFQTIRKRYDENINTVFTDTLNQVKMANDFSANIGLTTRIYGDYYFKGKRLKQIRHVAIPTLSASFRPDFSENQYGYYQQVQTDANGAMQQYSIFQNGIYGSPAAGQSGLIGFNLSNTIEAKSKVKSDSGAVYKKTSLLDNLGVAFNYNLAAKHFKWSTINLNARTRLFKRFDIFSTAVLDPYQLDSTGARTEKYEWNNERIGRLTNGSLSISTNLQSKQKSNAKKTSALATQDELDFINKNPNAYIDFDVPWNLNIYYNVIYNKLIVQQTSGTIGYTTKDLITQSLTFSGDVSLTKKWKVSVTSGYDFTRKEFTLTSINVYRDLHCWEMHFNWVPFGFRQSFSIDINVKSSVLRDLKLSRRKDWFDYR
jgi:lipopolysaccharide assembly outer membrane protein LptD (OstA)